MAQSPQNPNRPSTRRNPDRVPGLSILFRVLGVAAVIAIGFWVITSIGIRTSQNSNDDLSAVSVLNDVKAAQESAHAATGDYVAIDQLISDGYLTAPSTGTAPPTIEDVAQALGDDCFIIAVRSASNDVYYNWSEPRSSKKLDPNDPPDTSWCAPFPMPAA